MTQKSPLFEELVLREIVLRNRIAMSPMCMYSSTDGTVNDWHRTHLGARAAGGAGLILTEATAIEPVGRISPADAGIWSDEQIPAWVSTVELMKDLGTVPGVQIAHAGRKAGTHPPWAGRGPVPIEEGGWIPVAPSPIPFGPLSSMPRGLLADELPELVALWAAAAARARRAGFEVLEIHMAHGYLLHQFLSPLTNRRTDRYGGSLANRLRFPLEVTAAVRAEWPSGRPLFVRISATDWVDGGWDLEQAVELAKALAAHGTDLIDCSSGGAVPEQKIPAMPGFQVPFAEEIRARAKIATGAVGMITTPKQAEEIVRRRQADLVLLGRELLRNPYWPQEAARALGVPPFWPRQYAWAVG